MIATPILKGFASMDAYLYSTISDAEAAELERIPCQCSRCGLQATVAEMGRLALKSGHLCLACNVENKSRLKTEN